MRRLESLMGDCRAEGGRSGSEDGDRDGAE